MEKNVNPRAEAMKEISKEKARIFRKKTEGPSLLEQIALAWKKKKEKENRQRQKEILEKQGSLAPSFRDALAKEIVDYDKERLPAPSAGGSDEVDWVQYKPWQKEEDKKEKQIPLNMATIVAIRKKLVAMEWARALGKTKRDTRFRNLEQEAATWYQKREKDKRRKEEIRMKIERHKGRLSEALAEFGKTLREKKDALDPKGLSVLLEESLENVGEVLDMEWLAPLEVRTKGAAVASGDLLLTGQESGCLIWIEPWEEKKLRRISGFDIPIIYRVNIDEYFEITSFEEVEDEEIIESLREEVLTKPLRESLEGASFNIDNEDEAKEFLEDKLVCIGRLINLERTETGWLATIEPWEEMRIRNMKRQGKPPIVSEEIEIDWKDGKLEFAPEEEEGDDIEKTQMD